MTPQRAKPAAPRPDAQPSFTEDSLLIGCEHDDCQRQARMTCPKCDGDFCRWHARHPKHDSAVNAS